MFELQMNIFVEVRTERFGNSEMPYQDLLVPQIRCFQILKEVPLLFHAMTFVQAIAVMIVHLAMTTREAVQLLYHIELS